MKRKFKNLFYFFLLFLFSCDPMYFDDNQLSVNFVTQMAKELPDQDSDWWVDLFDCAPEDPNIHPGALEIPDNCIDEDCDGLDDHLLEDGGIILVDCDTNSDENTEIDTNTELNTDMDSALDSDSITDTNMETDGTTDDSENTDAIVDSDTNTTDETPSAMEEEISQPILTKCHCALLGHPDYGFISKRLLR